MPSTTVAAGAVQRPTGSQNSSAAATVLLTVLNPTAVRERAKSIRGVREVLADGPTTLSFIVGYDDSTTSHGGQGRDDDYDGKQVASKHHLARVNIWTDTGTVGTCRVVDGKVRQSFRRGVQSLDVIERLLKHPEGPVEIDASLVGMTDHRSEYNDNTDVSSPRSVQKEVELADVGIGILKNERTKLQKHLDDVVATSRRRARQQLHQQQLELEQKRKDDINQRPSRMRSSPRDREHSTENDDNSNASDMSSSSKSSTASSAHGTELHFKLPTDVMNQVDQCLNDIAGMGKTVKGFATNGKGTVLLYGNGGVAYTPSIPKALYQKLRQLRSSSYSSRPCFVALGTRDRYYVSFNDGKADWKGPGALDKILKKAISQPNPKMPRCVSFGSTYDTFFVVFNDGSWQYQGRGFPESLETKLGSRQDRADLEVVNLGPSGEWFVKAENGRMWWSGISSLLDERVQHVLNSGGYIHSMDFGENGSYFLSYDES